MSFSSLKRNRSSIEDLVKKAEKSSGPSKQQDVFWKPTQDKAGNGYAIIRFLPSPTDGVFWTQYWDHGFQGPTGLWYIENSRTSLGKDEADPVSELNQRLWNSGVEADKDIARKQKRRLHYVANIYVVSDPNNPDAEGKVMLYKFGKKIFDKLVEAMQPQFEDETPINPFDMWEGADFKLKVRKVDGWINYDKSEFSKPNALLGGDDAELEKIYNQTHDLGQFTDPKNYKSYDELSARLRKVLGENALAPTRVSEQLDMENVRDQPPMKEKKADDEPPFVPDSSPADDDDLSYFESLINS